MASTYLYKTPSSAGSRVKWTYSVWLKRGAIEVQTPIWAATTDGSNYDEFYFNSGDKIQYSTITGGTQKAIRTTRVFRDTSAWYHIVLIYDTGNSTDTDHAQLWINGVRETSFEDTTLLASGANNVQSNWNNNIEMKIGRVTTNTAAYYDGSMAVAEFVNNQTYVPTYFGSFDSNTGIWTPTATSTIADYGTNGFKLKMDTTSPGADTSGKGNTFSVGGPATLLQGSPDNNWCTWTPLAKYNRSATFANGNTTVNSNNNSLWDSARGAFGFQKGKWYWETKFFGSSAAFNYIGVCNENAIMGTNDAYDKNAVTVFYNSDGGEMRKDGSATSANYGTFSTSDVCGVAVDADNNTISIYKNNSIIVTNYALSTYANQLNGTGFIFPNAAVLDNGSGQYTNFGEGFFGTVAAGTSADGNGQGLFAFSPPSGYYALNTKNLEAYG